MASNVLKPFVFSPLFLRIISNSSKICACPIMTTSCMLKKKFYDPKWRKERGAKVQKITLPDFEEERLNKKLSIEEIRVKLKEKGIAPSREWNEKPMFVDSSGGIFDEYVPPEGDGKISSLTSGTVMSDMYDKVGKKGKSYLALKKIRKIDYEFDIPTVAEKAKDVYIEAHKALAEKDEDKLHDLTTEKGFLEMYENVKCKSIVWNFIQCLEPPRIVQIRCQDMMDKNNVFAQVTVRLHTQQVLAVYDRFGRLMHGSEDTVKDVLDYIVFEKHLTNPYSTWKVHGKIIPNWLPPRDSILKTYQRPDIDKDFPEPKEEPPKQEAIQQTGDTAVATA